MPKFYISSPGLSLCPPPDRPEFVFIGRSNVGKSSLINMLLRRKLALTSGTPGKTKLINYFDIPDGSYWVDLPGFGYAKTSKTNRVAFAEMITEYLTGRENIVCIFVLIDIRHSPQKIDVEFMEFLGENELPFCMVFTKADKLSKTAADTAAAAYKNTLLETWLGLPDAIVTSAEKQTGRDELLAYTAELVQLWKKKPVVGKPL